MSANDVSCKVSTLRRRYFFTFAAAVSLVFAVAMATLWVRSYSLEESVHLQKGLKEATFGTTDGLVYFTGSSYSNWLESAWSIEFRSEPTPDIAPAVVDILYDIHGLGGFGCVYRPPITLPVRRTFVATLPIWFLVSLLLILPVLEYRRRWRKRLTRSSSSDSKDPNEQASVI